MNLGGIIRAFQTLRNSLIIRGRLRAAEIPGTNGLQAKYEAARASYEDFEVAADIDRFAFGHFNRREQYTISWPENLVSLLGQWPEGLFLMNLRDLIQQLGARIVFEADKLCSGCTETRMLNHCSDFVRRKVACSETERLASKYAGCVEVRREPSIVRKAVPVPLLHRLDGVFRPGYSVLETGQRSFEDTESDAMSYFWYLSIKECLAAELCALNIAEYDGLPLAFYCDMAKQMLDECRHACHFVNTALRWLSARSCLDGEDSGFKINDGNSSAQFELSIPREGNFFETIHASDLAERLILMNIKTESIAVRRLKERLESRLCANSHFHMLATEVDLQDEISHVRIGTVWLKHLFPDPEQRKSKIDDTMLLRGVLMLNTIAVSQDRCVSDMIKEMLAARTDKAFPRFAGVRTHENRSRQAGG